MRIPLFFLSRIRARQCLLMRILWRRVNLEVDLRHRYFFCQMPAREKRRA
jgi:hypothetical protein